MGCCQQGALAQIVCWHMGVGATLGPIFHNTGDFAMLNMVLDASVNLNGEGDRPNGNQVRSTAMFSFGLCL